MKYLIHTAVCILALTVFYPAATAAQELQPLLFRQLGSEEGLAAGNISCLLRDRYGYLWIAAENGLTRFDGINCRVYKHNEEDRASLSGNFCNNIIEDRRGDLWIGTQNALTRYNRQTDDFSSFYLSPGGDTGSRTRQYVFPFFIDDRERLWLYLGSKGSVYCYDPATGRLDSVSSFSNGYLFATQPFYTHLQYYVSRGVKGIFINYLDGIRSKKTLSCFTYGNTAGHPVTFISQVYRESDSLLWLSSDTGLIRFNPEKNTWRIYDRYAGRQISAQSICAYGSDYFLIGTAGRGLILFDRRKERFTGAYIHRSYDRQSIESNTTGYCLMDEAQNLFVVTGNRDVSYTNTRQAIFRRYMDREDTGMAGMDNNITAVLQTGAYTLWCGTQGRGIIVYDWRLRKVIRVYDSDNMPGLDADQIRQLLRLHNGDILIFSRKGYTLYQLRTGRFIPLEQTNSEKLSGQLILNRFQYLPDGRLVAVTEHGLADVIIRSDHTIHFRMREEVNNAVEWPHFSFLHMIGDSLLLLQTYYTNLHAFTYHNGAFRYLKKIGSTPFHIYNAVTTGDTTWLATSAGLKMLVDTRKGMTIQETEIDVPCYDLILSGPYHLWIGTSSGLYRYNVHTRGHVSYTRNEGLQDNVFNPHTMTRLTDGSIIAAGINGFNRFHPALIRDPVVSCQVQLGDILVNDSRRDISCNPALCKRLELPYGSNTLSFHLTSVGFIQPEQNVFWYQLADYDRVPVKITGHGNVRYAQLPPGDYEFRLYRDTADAPVRRMQIIISPPVWDTWWFLSIVSVVMAGTVFLLVRLRINSIKRRQLDRVQVMIRSQEEERRRVARDLHDDFGARLSTLKLYMQAARKKHPGDEGQNDLLRQSTDMIDDAIASLRNILLNLGPKTLEGNGLQEMLCEMADHINSSGMLRCEVDTAAFPISLRPEAAHALYRICQELMNNTIKYAHAKHIDIALVQRPGLLLFLYEDDGIGFDPEKVKRGYGITNIETHVQALRGSLLLDTGAGRGMAVTIELPLFHVNAKQ